MMRRFKGFLTNNRGSVSIITATSLGVMLMLGAGATDFARMNKMRSAMQSSADIALLTSLKLKDAKWSKRVRFSNKFFKTNFSHPTYVSKMTSRLSGQKQNDRLIVNLKASAKVSQIFPNGLNFFSDEIEVVSYAEISARTNYEPQLITKSMGSTASQGNAQP